jgi:hypothetical protein
MEEWLENILHQIFSNKVRGKYLHKKFFHEIFLKEFWRLDCKAPADQSFGNPCR